MNVIRKIFSILSIGITVLWKIIGFFAAATEPGASRRSHTESSDLIGNYNFRTGKMDAGTDPNGWYEDDM